MRHRVSLQQPATDVDEYGQPNPDDQWTTYATVWGLVTPLDASEKIDAEQVVGEQRHRVKLRYLDGVEPDHRLLFEGRTLHIIGVVNVRERNEELVLSCVERS